MKKKSDIKIGATYAKAWFDGALELNELEKAFADTEKLSGSFDAENLKLLSSPIIPFNIKTDAVKDISTSLKLSKSTKNLLNILLDNSRFSQLPQVLKEFKYIYYKHNNIVEVCVETVKPLSKSQDEKLQQKLKDSLKQDVVIEYQIKPEIIGGLNIMFGTYRFDDSIKRKLDDLESIMKGNG